MRVSTPNSSMQLTLAEAVLAQDARLSYAIQARNPYSRKVARAASRELKRVLAMIERSDREAFDEHFSKLSKRVQDRQEGERGHKRDLQRRREGRLAASRWCASTFRERT